MSADAAPSPLGQPSLHESGLLHATGEARYVDDLPVPPNTLVGWVLTSPHAHARLLSLDAAPALQVPGVVAVLTAQDIPGHNQVGPVVPDEPLLADTLVQYLGQSLAVVLGETAEACRAGARAIRMKFEVLPALTCLEDAMAAESWLCEPHRMVRGDVDAALPSAPLRFRGLVHTGAQDHFYLETQCSLAIPGERQTLHILSSTQHPSEVQTVVAEVLGCDRSQVVVEVPRLGGGFGGKETQAAPFAALAALGAIKTGRPVKLWLNRDQDMVQTGKRHPFRTEFDAGFDLDGRLLALSASMVADGGWANDLSRAILDRGLFHLDNAYYIPALRFEGRAAKTHLPSNTAFRGFGGPQGMAVIESILNQAAERLHKDPAEVRQLNFYGPAPRNRTPYDQEVVFADNRLEGLWTQLLERSDYRSRRRAIEARNAQERWVKRGIAITPVKFGISFTTSFLNQAGALVLVYADGSVQLNHGGIEMGQGLHTKMLAVCAHELGISADRIRAMNTATDKVPNTSATAASSGSDLNGQAVADACRTLRLRLEPVARELLQSPADIPLKFSGNAVSATSGSGKSLAFRELVQAAYLRQVSLSAVGYYRTPDIHYDRAQGKGKPFHYYAYGAAVTEVAVNGLTGETRFPRVDILHDCGSSLNPSIDLGQIEGGYLQGLGWLTCEEVIYRADGTLLTHSPDTYKIPACGDAPADFRVALLERAEQHNTLHGSKAVGEPPLMLALSATMALRHAVSAFGPPGRAVDLAIPSTPEAVLRAVQKAQAQST